MCRVPTAEDSKSLGTKFATLAVLIPGKVQTLPSWQGKIRIRRSERPTRNCLQAVVSTSTNTDPSLATASVVKPVMRDAAVGTSPVSSSKRRLSSSPLPAVSTFVLPRPPPRPRWRKGLSRVARGVVAVMTAVSFQRVCDTSSAQRLLDTENVDIAPVDMPDVDTSSGEAVEDIGTDFDASPELESTMAARHVENHIRRSSVMAAARANADRLILVGGAMVCATL